MYEQRSKFLRMAKNQINDGVKPELIKKSLMDHGTDEKFAVDVLDEAARTMTIGEKRTEEKDSGTSIWTVLFVVFIVIRIILRMAQS